MDISVLWRAFPENEQVTHSQFPAITLIDMGVLDNKKWLQICSKSKHTQVIARVGDLVGQHFIPGKDFSALASTEIPQNLLFFTQMGQK